jgi:prevent-host-death family protein
MAKTIPQRELRNNNAGIIEAVAAGESFVITRNGVPVADLTPVRTTRRRLVPTTELVALFSQGPHIDRQSFREDVDRVIDPEL